MLASGRTENQTRNKDFEDPRNYQETDMQIPPNDKNAEKAILGSALRSKDSLTDLIAKIQAEDFYHFAHQKIWEAMSGLGIAGKPVDPVTLADQIKVAALIEDIGGYAYLVELWETAPIGGNDYYVGIIKSMKLKRDLMEFSYHALEQAASFQPADEVLEETERAMFELSKRHRWGKNALTTTPSAVTATLENLDRRAQRKDEIELPFGWVDIDHLTHGLQRGELTVLGARPSVGKTMFAMQVAENLAANGKRVFVASMEQTAASLVERMMCRQTKINSWCFRAGRIPEDQQPKIFQAADVLSSYQILFDDSSRQTVSRIVSQARRASMANRLDLVVVDYLTLIEPEKRKEQRYLQIGLMCQRLKQLAKDLECPVMLLSQLSRSSESKRPNLSDLRESGDIEQHADCVMLLHRPEEPDVNDPSDVIEVLIRKQRNGPTGDVKLLHMRDHYQLHNMGI
jgi:replicative DNA helicase